MKKLLFSCVAMAAFALMTSCSSSSSGDSSTPPPAAPAAAETFANNYFTAEGSTYHEGALPAPTGTQAISGVTMNNSALASGANFIGINSAQAYRSFYVGIQGVDGYLEVPAVSRANNVYVIPLIFGQNFSSTITIIVIGLTTDGVVTQPFIQPVTFVESAAGDLHVNLTFDNAKDIDLHLITPSGVDIFYGNREIETTVGQEKVKGGLDHDSNAGCTIDDLNNENIVLPAALIEPGVYTVEVDMWSNCNTSIATQWTINARYNGAFLTNLLTLPTAAENQTRVQGLDTDVQGSNPVYGTYPVNAKSSRNSARTAVMKFQIAAAPAAAPRITQSYKPTDMDEMKMEEETWYRVK